MLHKDDIMKKTIYRKNRKANLSLTSSYGENSQSSLTEDNPNKYGLMYHTILANTVLQHVIKENTHKKNRTLKFYPRLIYRKCSMEVNLNDSKKPTLQKTCILIHRNRHSVLMLLKDDDFP